MSADNWRALNRLTADPVFRRHASLPLTIAWLDRAVTSLMTLSGFVLDGMTRGIGWRFLSIGRRLERLSTLCQALQVATDEGRSHGLDWLLEFADSTVTYRSRYLVGPEWLPVLDMVLRDEANPRSVAFQVKGLLDYIVEARADPWPLRERPAGAGAGRAAGARRRTISTRTAPPSRACWSSCAARRMRCRTSCR